MLRSLVLPTLALALLITVPGAAAALTDGGAPSAGCSDSDEWMFCRSHSECPEGLVCSGGACACECPYDRSRCEGPECSCCPFVGPIHEDCHVDMSGDGCPQEVCPDDESDGCSAAGTGSVPWGLLGFLLSWVAIRRRPRR